MSEGRLRGGVDATARPEASGDERTGRRELQLLQRYEDAAFKLEFLRDFFAPLRCDVGKVRLQGPCHFDDQLARAVF